MTFRKTGTNDPRLQRLFERLNKRYFNGSLPSYVVIRSNRFGQGKHGLCRKRQREIHIGPDLTGSLLKRVLLHEMAHAASRSGHGRGWLAEMDRLAKLGAPTRSDWRDYQSRRKTATTSDICLEARDHGFERPDVRWAEYKIYIGQSNGLCDAGGRSESRRAARCLRKIRHAFLAGQNDAKRVGLYPHSTPQEQSLSRAQSALGD